MWRYHTHTFLSAHTGREKRRVRSKELPLFTSTITNLKAVNAFKTNATQMCGFHLLSLFRETGIYHLIPICCLFTNWVSMEVFMHVWQHCPPILDSDNTSEASFCLPPKTLPPGKQDRFRGLTRMQQRQINVQEAGEGKAMQRIRLEDKDWV